MDSADPGEGDESRLFDASEMQTEAPVPQVSFNQFNQQVQLIFPPM